MRIRDLFVLRKRLEELKLSLKYHQDRKNKAIEMYNTYKDNDFIDYKSWVERADNNISDVMAEIEELETTISNLNAEVNHRLGVGMSIDDFQAEIKRNFENPPPREQIYYDNSSDDGENLGPWDETLDDDAWDDEEPLPILRHQSSLRRREEDMKLEENMSIVKFPNKRNTHLKFF